MFHTSKVNCGRKRGWSRRVYSAHTIAITPDASIPACVDLLTFLLGSCLRSSPTSIAPTHPHSNTLIITSCITAKKFLAGFESLDTLPQHNSIQLRPSNKRDGPMARVASTLEDACQHSPLLDCPTDRGIDLAPLAPLIIRLQRQAHPPPGGSRAPT